MDFAHAKIFRLPDVVGVGVRLYRSYIYLFFVSYPQNSLNGTQPKSITC